MTEIKDDDSRVVSGSASGSGPSDQHAQLEESGGHGFPDGAVVRGSEFGPGDLAVIRHDRGLTQEKAARELQVGLRTYARWEGEKVTRFGTLILRLAGWIT